MWRCIPARCRWWLSGFWSGPSASWPQVCSSTILLPQTCEVCKFEHLETTHWTSRRPVGRADFFSGPRLSWSLLIRSSENMQATRWTSRHPALMYYPIATPRFSEGLLIRILTNAGYPLDIPPPGSDLLTYCVLCYHLPLLIAFSLRQQTDFVWGGFMLLPLHEMLADKYGIMKVSNDRML